MTLAIVSLFGKFIFQFSYQIVFISACNSCLYKTTFQMVMICLMIANIEALSVLTTIVMWVALVLTVVSLVDYLMKNKDVLKDQH